MARYRRVLRRPVVVVPEPPLSELRKDELIARAEKAGLDSSGTKADIIARLESAGG